MPAVVHHYDYPTAATAILYYHDHADDGTYYHDDCVACTHAYDNDSPHDNAATALPADELRSRWLRRLQRSRG